MIKRGLKYLVWLILYSLRCLLNPIFKFKEISVLVYHSVDYNGWKYSVDPDVFEKQMKYLKENFNVVPLPEIVQYVRTERDLPSKSVAITFDDGYLDNYKNAFPILKKYQLPATIFLTTGFVGKERFSKSANISFRMLNWEQIREMSQEGVLIGSHSVSHPKLNLVSEEKLKEEIEKSKEKIEKELGQEVKYFAYPKGVFNEKVIAFLKETSYEAALSTKRGLIKKGDDEFIIKRNYSDRSLSMMEFKAILTKAVDWQVRIAKIYHRIWM